jgi:hypothetical protein
MIVKRNAKPEGYCSLLRLQYLYCSCLGSTLKLKFDVSILYMIVRSNAKPEGYCSLRKFKYLYCSHFGCTLKPNFDVLILCVYPLNYVILSRVIEFLWLFVSTCMMIDYFTFWFGHFFTGCCRRLLNAGFLPDTDVCPCLFFVIPMVCYTCI